MFNMPIESVSLLLLGVCGVLFWIIFFQSRAYRRLRLKFEAIKKAMAKLEG